jgi:hypothetical protein
MEARSFVVMSDPVRSNKQWSNYMEEIWQEQYRKARIYL